MSHPAAFPRPGSRAWRRGFTLVELGIAITILISLATVSFLYYQRGSSEAAEAGTEYATNYGADVTAATSTGTVLPDWDSAARDGQAFTILSRSETTVPGVYVFRWDAGGEAPSDAFYGSGAGGTLEMGGPWEPAMGCLAEPGRPIAEESLTDCSASLPSS